MTTTETTTEADSASFDPPELLDASLAEAEAEALTSAGRHVEAVDAWRRVAEHAYRNGDHNATARARLAAAHCAFEADETVAALADAELAFAAATTASEPGLAAEAAELRADLAWPTGDGAETEHWLRNAATGYETASRDLDRARVMMSLGHFLGVDRRYDDAIEALTAARNVFRAHGRGLDASRCDDRLAAALIELGRLPEALDLLRSAALVADATGDSARIAYAQYRVGWTSVIAGLGREALPSLERARSLYSELGDLVGVAECDQQGANVFSETGEFERAEELYERAIAVFEAFGKGDDARIAESNLADILSRMRRHEQAASRRAAILERIPSTEEYLRAAVSVRLAEDLVKVGDAERALAVLREAGEYFENNGNRLEGAHYRAALARALLAGNYVSSARNEAETLLRSIERSTLPGAHAKALEVIAACLRDTTQKDAADRYLAQAVALYLAIGERDKATELSRDLLPESRPQPTSEPDPVPQGEPVYGAVYL